MKNYYYVAPIYFLAMQYAISLIRSGLTKDQATQQAIDRFAYYGKHNNKRLKDFNENIFRKHVNRFLNTPNAFLIRKSPKHR